jgi:hypothetical protein
LLVDSTKTDTFWEKPLIFLIFVQGEKRTCQQEAVEASRQMLLINPGEVSTIPANSTSPE